MANLFDSSNYKTSEPTEIVAGDRSTWKRDDLLTDYPSSDYSLSYSARLEASGATSISIDADSSYVVELPSTTTVNYTVGVYHWSAYITRTSDSERIEVDSGTFTVLSNKASSTTDPRSHVKRVLDAIESVIEGRATKDQESLSVEGMSLVRTPVEDLLTLHSKYKTLYAQEKRAERLRNGKGHSGKIYTRFK